MSECSFLAPTTSLKKLSSGKLVYELLGNLTTKRGRRAVREGGGGWMGQCYPAGTPLHSMWVTQTSPLLSSFRHVEDLGPGCTTRTRSKPRDHPAAPRGSDSPARW